MYCWFSLCVYIHIYEFWDYHSEKMMKEMNPNSRKNTNKISHILYINIYTYRYIYIYIQR